MYILISKTAKLKADIFGETLEKVLSFSVFAYMVIVHLTYDSMFFMETVKIFEQHNGWYPPETA